MWVCGDQGEIRPDTGSGVGGAKANPGTWRDQALNLQESTTHCCPYDAMQPRALARVPACHAMMVMHAVMWTR